MKIIRIPLLIFQLFHINVYLTLAQSDLDLVDTKKKSLLFKVGLCGTFTNQNHWNNENSSNILFSNNIDFNYRITSKKFLQNYQFKSDLGYTKLLDSVWMKNIDYWKININWSEIQSRKLTHSYSLLINSQFLPTYRYQYEISTDNYEKRKVASVFNPGRVTLAYGLNYQFWQGNYINFNFASISFYSKPTYTGNYKPDDNSVGRTNNSYLYFDYGFNINAMIYYKINEVIQWENTSYYFMNGVNKNQIQFDIVNRVIFVLWKYVQFRVDTHLIYDPKYSYNIQNQNAFTIGLVYEVKNYKK